MIAKTVGGDTIRYTNGLVVTYEYDEVNRLVREKILDKNGAPVVEYTYTLGAAGERIKVEETGAASDRTVEYEYDALYRLVKETVTDDNGTTVTEYTYDRNSNRLTKTMDGEITSYIYNELNQLVTETGIIYEYDLNGNLIKKTEPAQTTTYTYNAQNKLIRVTVQGGQSVNVEEYCYDYAGNRIAKIGELSTINYLVDTNGVLSQVLAEYDENGSLTTLYTRGDELISQERGGEKHYYLYDGFDSVRMLTDEGGSVTDTYTFDAFGNITDSTGDTENSYLYRGEQYDSFTGLYYLRARYMNPSTGTFITMDEYAGSVFDPVSLHKYLYANASSVMFSDPSGYNSLADVETSSAGMAIVSEAYSSACMTAARAGARILALLRTSITISVMTAPFFFPLASALGDICGGLLDGTGSSASICDDVRDNVVDDALSKADDKTKRKKKGWIKYLDLDEYGRATGADAYITPDMIGTGSPANHNIIPKDYVPNKGYARGHLIAKNLGGSGNEKCNLVTIYQNPVNTPIMRGYEMAIAARVLAGEGIRLTVRPVYGSNNKSGIPRGISMIAVGDSGYKLEIFIPNNK